MNNFKTSRLFKVSSNYYTDLAPVIATLTSLFLIVHATANYAGVHPNSLANATKFLNPSTFLGLLTKKR